MFQVRSDGFGAEGHSGPIAVELGDGLWFAGDPGKDERPNPIAEYVGQRDIDQFQ